MPRVGFEATIPAFERAKAVHVLDRAANVMAGFPYECEILCILCNVYYIVTYPQELWSHNSRPLLGSGP
jgi:hypothetical protein